MKKVTVLISLCALVLAFVPTALADWDHDVKWDQLDPVTTYQAWSWLPDLMTADDFQCDETGYITDIEFYAQPLGGLPETIRITFWSDVPACANNESHPGLLLADITVGASDPGDPLGLGWHVIADYVPLGNEQKFRINLPQEDWFVQEEGSIYWIGIQGSAAGFMLAPRDMCAQHWLDDAVYKTVGMPADLWQHWGWKPTDAGGWTLDRYEGLIPAGWVSADICYRLTGTAIPEPASIALVTLGGLLVALLRRRKHA